MVKVGIIGAGNIARKMAHTINCEEKATAYAVAARDLTRAQAFADEFDFEKAYGSYLELVEDPEVELVYVATTHNFHYEHCKLAMSNGKHVLCEKAITINADQLAELIKLAHEKQVTFMEAIWSRFMPLQLKLKQMLDEGMIGTPRLIQSNHGALLEDKERMYRPDLAGGALLDLGVYNVHFVMQMFGNDYATISSSMDLTEEGVDRTTAITLTYPDGRMAQMLTTMATMRYTDVLIVGDKGMFRIDGSNHIDVMRLYDQENQLVETYQRPADNGGFDFQLREAIKLIEEGKIESDIVSLEDSMVVMRIMDTVRAQHGFKYPEEK